MHKLNKLVTCRNVTTAAFWLVPKTQVRSSKCVYIMCMIMSKQESIQTAYNICHY